MSGLMDINVPLKVDMKTNLDLCRVNHTCSHKEGLTVMWVRSKVTN
jgi:hypothetical protein